MITTYVSCQVGGCLGIALYGSFKITGISLTHRYLQPIWHYDKTAHQCTVGRRNPAHYRPNAELYTSFSKAGSSVNSKGESKYITTRCRTHAHYAEEMGGALWTADGMEITDSTFAKNTARDGLAVSTLETPLLLWNVTFNDNILTCPLQTYSYTQEVSSLFLVGSPRTSVTTVPRHVQPEKD